MYLLLLAHHVAVELLIARVPSEFESDCPFSTGSATQKNGTAVRHGFAKKERRGKDTRIGVNALEK